MKNKFKLTGIGDESADRIKDQLKMHQKLGWRYIEIRNVNRTTIDTLEEDMFKEMVHLLKEEGIQVSCLASDVGKLTLGNSNEPFAQDIDSLNKLISRAEELDCKYIRVMGYKQGDLSAEKWRDESIKRLKELSRIAEKNEIYLGLENCVGWHAKSGERMKEVLKEVNSPSLVCLFDTGNPDPKKVWSFYTEVKEYIKYIHIKDKNKDGSGFTYPGEGQSQVRRILKDQYEEDYRGFVSIEPHMSSSAHLPDMEGDAVTSWETYKGCGEKLNEIVRNL
ncbi:MAG: sugar phosphate isomerase/epimerase family protein [Halanaerobiales bacterium]